MGCEEQILQRALRIMHMQQKLGLLENFTTTLRGAGQIYLIN